MTTIEAAPGRFGNRPRSRGRALLLALVLHVVAFTVLLLQRPTLVPMQKEAGIKTFFLQAETDKEKGEEPQAQAKTESRKVAQAQEAPPEPTQETPPPPPPVQTPSEIQSFQLLQLSSADMAAGNIGKMRNGRPAAAADAGGGDSATPAGPGSGPGGATLYPADWYREPSSAQLGGYLSADQPRTGYGDIACQTVAQYHVDNCYILGESPRGSGFGRSVLNAAWQFLVLPPRVNGKYQVGTWVRIRITYTPGGGAGPG
jgi:protein TonB